MKPRYVYSDYVDENGIFPNDKFPDCIRQYIEMAAKIEKRIQAKKELKIRNEINKKLNDKDQQINKIKERIKKKLTESSKGI